MFHIARVLEKQNYSHNIRIYVLTNHVQEVFGNEPSNPGKATILGLLKVIPQEYAGIRCGSIDIELPQPGISEEEVLVDLLLEEFTIDSAKIEAEVAYRNNQRWEQVYDSLHLEAPPQEQLKLKIRPKGVFLITGGLGKIGLMFAELFLKHAAACVILTGRSPLPSESFKTKKLQELEEMGGEVIYIQVDAANLEQMRKVVNEAERKFGAINGIIHAAGIIEGQSMRTINDLTTEDCQQQFQAKVFGVMVLNELFKDKPLDFCWLLSSISCVLGGLGFGAYASANCFMDAFVKKHNHLNSQNSFWLSLNWDGMDSSTSIDIFERIFTLTKTAQLVVSRQGNLQQRIDQWIKLNSVKEPGTAGKVCISHTHPRPVLSNNYEAPRNPLEKTIAGIWQQLLGFDAIGIKDDFLELGGDSLKAITLISHIHRESGVNIPVTDFFSHPTIEQITAYIQDSDSKNKTTYISIEQVEKKEYYLLSSAQLRIYVLHQMDIESKAYNLPFVFELKSKMEFSKVENSFKELIKRHESFRTSFIMSPQGPGQVIHDDVDFTVEYFACNEADVPGILANFVRPFKLEKPPLMRVGLIKTNQEKHILILDIFHIITDGVSFDILIKEFMSIYQASTSGKENELPLLKIQYKDYAEWLKRLQQVENFIRQKEYWEKEFEEEIPVLELPVDYARPAVQSFEGNSINFEINNETSGALKALAMEVGATLYMILLALYTIHLSRLTGQDDIVIGSPVAGRRHTDLEKIIGMFVNTLALRNYPVGEKMFRDFLAEIKEKTLKAFENQDYQYEDLVEKVAVTRDTSRNPLFDTMFVLQNVEIAEINIPGLKLSPYPYENKTAKFDLTLTAFEAEEKLFFNLEYSTKLFKEETINRFIAYFKNIINGVIENKDRKICDFEIITEEEKKRILVDFNDTEAEYPKDKTIHQLFEEQATKTPDYIAIVGNADVEEKNRRREKEKNDSVDTLRPTSLQIQMSYRQLNEQSDRLAALLVKKGILPDNIVGIRMERSVEMIISIIGILKACGAYLPIDPEYPQERIAYMLKDSNAKILINKSEIRNPKFETNPNNQNPNDQNKSRNFEIPFVLNLDHLNFEFVSCLDIRASNLFSSNLAYIIYTSGTTGKPKGTLIEHTNVVRLLFNDRCLFDFHEKDSWTMFHSYCFDFSVWEMYGALLYGGKLYIIPKIITQDPQEFLILLKKNQITILNQTPSAFYNLMLEELKYPNQALNLRYVIFGGEALSPAKLKEWKEKYPATKLINMFGITETTVHVTYKEITAEEIEAGISCIGTPIPTLSTYIFDCGLKLAPIGTPGELCVGGKGVGRGYLNQPELSNEKFIKNPFKKNEILYKSGDLARLSTNGEIEYLGRIDQQFQIRGFRVESGEIKNRLLKHETVKDAVVIAKEDKDNNKYLIAYIVSDSRPSVTQLIEFLSIELPVYMIPSYFIQIPHIPLTPNGKIDKSALPGPDVTSDEVYTAPGDKIEEALVEAWKKVLEIEKIGVNDSFFKIGGDSIKAIRLTNAINNGLHSDIKIADLFNQDTIRKLGKIIKNKTHILRDKELEEIEKEFAQLKANVIKSGKMPEDIEDVFLMSDIEKGMIFHTYSNPDAAIYHDQFLYYRKYTKFDPAIFRMALELMVEKHSALRVSYDLDNFSEFIHFIHKPFPAVYKHFDIHGLEGPNQQQYLITYMEDDRKNKWDITTPPLWRMTTFDLGNDNVCALWAFHHAILDGWSNASLMTELNNTYLELKNNKAYTPGKLKISYKDFIIEEIIEKKKKANIDFWKKELDGYKRISFPDPVKNEKDEIHNFIPASVISIDEKLNTALKHYNTNLKHICFAAYLYMLNMLTYENDVVVGLISHNRPEIEDGDKLIGCFLNTLPFRINIPGKITCKDYIQLVNSKIIRLKQYEKITFYEIVKVVGERNHEENPIFDTIYNYVDFHIYKQLVEDDKQVAYDGNLPAQGYERTNTLFDFTVSPGSQRIHVILRYSTSVIDDELAKKLYCYFENILDMIVSRPGGMIKKDEFFSPEEKQQILYKFNETNAEYPKDKTIHGLFEEQTVKTLDYIALYGCLITGRPEEEVAITYKELNEKSNRLAHVLKEKQVQPGTIIGIKLERSIEMIITILGILKSGGAYLPIDASYPRERIDYMLKDSKAKMIIDYEFLLNIPQAQLHHSSFIVHHSNHLAYLIYTSGSTGKPKGVMVEHRSVVNYIKWAIKNYIQNETTITLPLFTPLSFDLTVTSIFTPLLSGNSILIYKDAFIDKIIEDNRAQVVKLTPSHLKIISGIGQKFKSNIKRFIVGGESLETKLAENISEKFSKSLEIYNEYGPTEATVGCMIYRFSAGYDMRLSVPIGTPADNVQIYLLDKDRHPVPLGTPGELYIGGDGVARGYLNSMELTAERFNNNLGDKKNYWDKCGVLRSNFHHSSSIIHHSNLYRTGDLARWLNNGNIEFLGRIDQQVKIRGFRIELDEIQKKILEYKKHTPLSTEGLKTLVNQLAAIPRCSKCLLPANYPGIHFDHNGVCNICLEYKEHEDKAEKYFKNSTDFYRLIEKIKKEKHSEYDCLLLFSGGKDSTYVLYKLINMGLKVLTFTFDNGYISDAAFANIKNITSNLGIENIVCRAKNMNRIFVESFHTNHNACHGCWNVLNTMGIKIAHEKNINLVISGLSRGQIVEMRLEGLFQLAIFDEQEIEKNLLLFRKNFHSRSNIFARILEVELAEEVIENIHFVDFFRYFNTPVSEINDYLTTQGWRRPENTGFCSSNCIINDVGIYVHLKETGYHFYAAPLSWDCRLGVISREQGLRETGFDNTIDFKDQILKEIGYYDSPVKDAVVIDNEDSNGDKYLCAYIISDEDLSIEDFRKYLAACLPEYMIPSYFVPINKIPLTSNGKIDRKALPAPEAKMNNEYVPPGNQIEKILAAIWSEILGRKKELIGIRDNFFYLGGHSLKATIMAAKIHKELNIQLPLVEIFKKPSINALSEYINELTESKYISLEPAEKKEYYDLSSVQKRLYVLRQLDEQGFNYNIPSVSLLAGDLDKNRLEKTFRHLLVRHESLRTSFTMVGVQPVQRIHEQVEFAIEYYDLTGINGENHAPEHFIHSFIRPFDLSTAPLLRVGLIRMAEMKYIFMVDMHHIITDGTSMDLFIKESLALYASEELPPLKFQYKDYTQWQNSDRQKQSLQAQEHFWINRFAEEAAVLDWPLDYPRPAVQRFEGNAVDFELTTTVSQTLKQMAWDTGATSYMVLLAIYNILLSKICGQEDIVVGTPVAARRHADLERIIGMFVNTLALRNYPNGEKTFREFLLELKDVALQAFENQEYPFEDLVEKILTRRDLSRNPIFDVMFTLQNTAVHTTDYKISGLIIKPYESEHRMAKFDLSLTCFEVEEKLYSSFEYCTQLFKKETIERFIIYFKQIIAHVIDNPIQKLSQIEIITPSEKHQILFEFNNEKALYPEAKAHELFEKQEAEKPGRIAVVYEDSLLSYGQVNWDVNQLARLFNLYGIGENHIVGILLDRSPRLFEIIMAIWKLGAAYIPMETDYPAQRVNEILSNSETPFLITRSEYVHSDTLNVFRGHIIKMDQEENVLANQCSSNLNLKTPFNNLAYILFTSGSTGKPKGAMVEHIGSMNHMHGKIRDTEMTADSVMVQNGPQTFDVCIWQFFAPLTLGSRTVMYSYVLLLDPDQLINRLIRDQVTILEVVPSYLTVLLDFFEKRCPESLPLKYLLPTGEELKPLLVKRWFELFPGIKVINTYGPTEASDDVAHYIMDKMPQNEIIPLGSPLPNLNMYVVDKYMNLCPIGIKGEICVSGIGVGRGYLNDEEKTKKVFMEDPFVEQKGVRLYKMGDTGCWIPDGNLLFFGRKDYQVKIRGHLVECGEIEKRLLGISSIKEAVVIDLEEAKGHKYLIAYLVSDEKLNIPDIKSQLAAHLPDYMIPSYFVLLKKIPLTPNGKIDRKALPAPELKAGENYIAPRDEIEKKLAGLWAQVLGRDTLHVSQLRTSIGINDDFFHLGGHSLKAMTLMSKIHKVFDVIVPLTEIFKTPRIKELAKYIKRKDKEFYMAMESAEKKEYYRLSSAQKRLYILQQMDIDSTVYNITLIMMLEGIVDRNRFEQSVLKVIKRHESLRTSVYVINDEPVQRIYEDIDFEIEYKNLPTDSIDYTNEKDNTFISEHFIQSFIHPFDLSKAPLLRVGLLKIKGDRHILMVDMPHIISDGTSMNILVKDFMGLYRGEDLLELRLQYKDFSQWQNSEKQRESIKRQEDFWIKEFAGEIPVLELPTDDTRPSVQNFEGSSIPFEIDKEMMGNLRKLILELNVTMYMILLAIYNVFLCKVTGQEEIVIGSPIAGRRHVDLETIIGMFVNTLVMRSYPSGEKTFSFFLQEVKEKTLKAFENQDYQYEDLVEKVAATRDTSRNPLFDTMFVLQNMEIAEINIPGLKLFPYPYENKTAKFDLTLTTVEVEEKLFFNFEYSTKLFKEETANRFITYFKNIVNGVIENKDRKIADYEIISEEEKKEILIDFNNTAADYPKDRTIHRLFEEQVERTPDRIAVVGSTAVETLRATSLYITYFQLNEQSNHLAGLLIEKGVLPDTIVGIMMERSVEMIIGIMGILKAGGAYLPINPKNPLERINHMLRDSGAILLAVANDLEGKKVRRWEGEKGRPRRGLQHSKNLAYIIYTSGSTGNPKGVPITHANICPLLHWGYKILDIGPNDRTLQNLSYYFDWSVWEIFITLTTGAKLYLVSDEVLLNPEDCIPFMKEKDITVLHVTPTQYHHFIGGGHKLETLKYLFLGAEKLSVDLLKRSFVSVKEECRVFNMYGPTEATIISAVLEIKRGDESRFENLSGVPIGGPVANGSLLVLDKYLNLSPVNVTGELYIGGAGLALGYLNNPELTAEKFRPLMPQMKNKNSALKADFQHSAFELLRIQHSILYCTGDLARWLPDGNIEFLGRIDQQVKIRGFRVELGEIENQLLKHRLIKEVVVVINEDAKDKKLTAYIISTEELIESEFREYLQQKLPEYMIPSYFVRLEKIPLTPNGKLDRKALPKPELKAGESYISPRDEIEKKLTVIWSEMLDQTPIGIEDNFFHLGGHSLKATVLASRIHKEFNVIFPLAVLFKTPTVRGLSEYIKGTIKNVYESIMPVEEKEYYVLSSAQKRMYILQQIDLNNTAYNMPELIPLVEEIDISILEESFKKLIKRHDSLRTSFHMIGDQPVQKVHQEVDFKIETFGRGDPAWSPDIIKNFIGPFDLSKAPLLRVVILEKMEGKNLLMVDMHHIISDGISNRVLREDFMALYEGKELSPLRIQYKDFAQWQNGEKAKEILKGQEKYWLKESAGEIPVLELPTDYPRPISQSFAGDSINFEISAEETQSLKSTALQGGATLFMVLAAAVNILLSKLSNHEEIIIGTPIAGRRHADLEKIIGMFVNTLALRNYPNGEQTFTEFLGDVKERTLLAFENQEYPFEELVNKLPLKRDIGRNPLFDAMFVLQNMGNRSRVEKAQPDVDEEIIKTTKFDLTIGAVESVQETLFSIQYCTALFKQETIERFITYFKKIIKTIVNEPGIKLQHMDVLPEKEKEQLMVDFNNTAAVYPEDNAIHQLFEAQVEKSPDNIAVVGSTVETLRATSLQDQYQITYHQLNVQSNILAGLLIEKGVLLDNIVAIMMERSVEMIVGILGILKSGGAYLPIDPDYPQERINYMLKDSKASILIIDNEKKTNNCQCSIVNCQLPMSEPRASLQHSSLHAFEFPRMQHSNHLAYIIYTSGSTGKPKGIMVEHRNVVNLAISQKNQFAVNEKDRILQFSSICFDASVEQIFIAFFSGAVLLLIDKNTLLDNIKFEKLISSRLITHLHAVPSFLNNISLKEGYQLKRVISGGDVCHPGLARKYGVYCDFYNEYGPTETTVTSIEMQCTDVSEVLDHLPIGKPIANTFVYIFDKWLKPVPFGVVGEMYIGGDGVSRGYLNRPELTAEKFIFIDKLHKLKQIKNNPEADFSHSSFSIQRSILYQTGDLCKWLSNGNIDFLGRIDHQVKIRGFRIELGEIENQLLKHKHIKEAVVVINEDTIKDKNLTAYIISSGELLEIELREYLKGKLPEYMIPSRFVQIEKIPLTPNGKIDRKALPKPELAPGEGYVAPQNDMEMKLVELWSELLNIQLEVISRDKSFFELGGHSLKATILASRIHKEFNVMLPLGEIFKAPTIKDIGKYIENAKSTIYKNIDWNLVLIKEGLPGDNHLFFIHDGSGEVEGYVEFCNHLTGDFNYWGIRADRLENLAPRNITIQELAKKYISSMKKIQPHGPYYIVGWSLGGTIAFEMAAQLEQMNEEIAFMALIDSPPPHKNLWPEASEFNQESEINFIKKYSPASELIEKAKDAPGVNQLWVSLVDYLEASHYDVEIIKKTIAEFGVQALPNFHQLDIKESIYYLNLGRTLRNARAIYQPSTKIHTHVHYFAASESKDIKKEYWKQYTSRDMKFYEIEGDHFSIFKIPGAVGFAKKFAAILLCGLDIFSIE